MAEPDPAQLERIAELLDAETLRVPIQRRNPLESAGDAIAALLTTHTEGKVGLVIQKG